MRNAQCAHTHTHTHEHCTRVLLPMMRTWMSDNYLFNTNKKKQWMNYLSTLAPGAKGHPANEKKSIN